MNQWVHQLSSGPPPFRVASPDETTLLATATDATQTKVAALVPQLDAVDPAQPDLGSLVEHDLALASSKAPEDGLQQRDALRGCGKPQRRAIGTGPVLDRHIRLAHLRILSDLADCGQWLRVEPLHHQPRSISCGRGQWTRSDGAAVRQTLATWPPLADENRQKR